MRRTVASEESERTMNHMTLARLPRSPADAGPSHRCVLALLFSPVFRDPESRDINNLVLILLCLARMRARASPREAPATHMTGRAVSAIPVGGCPILRLGR